MFSVGDMVLYGGEGVCRVAAVGLPPIAGIDKTREYYTLQPLYHSGQVMIPVDTGLLLRPLMTAEEAHQLLQELATLQPEEIDCGQTRLMKVAYQTILASYDCRRVAKLVRFTANRCRAARESGKKPSQLDERYLKRAAEQLYEEIAAALEIERSAVPDRVQQSCPGWPEDGK